jgi:DNA-binding NarL/FixJ family response regulator
MIRVLIADDEPMIRTGIRSILAADPDIEIVGDAKDGSEALQQARRYRPDVALLDIRMPVVDGLTATRQIRAELPDVAIIILTTFGEEEYIARALEYGAAGFLLKALDPRELIAGVHAVANGAACLSPIVAQKVITELRRSAPSRGQAARDLTARLAPRERDVLALLGTGMSNAEIAERLFLVEGTVKSYVSTILSRLKVRNRVQAAIIAVEAGLVHDPMTGR